ncbi:MAG: hypothetical protein U0V73_05110 [Acidimicrobiia bacterium]
MTSIAAGIDVPVTSRSRPEVLLLRMTGLALFLLVPAAVSSLALSRPGHRVAWLLCGYSPERLVHGEVWTLPASAFMLARLATIGPTTILVAVVFMPFVLVNGLRKAVWTFIVGHVGATLAVFAVVVPLAALGAPWARHVYLTRDVGASAGLMAVAGAMCVVLARRAPALGVGLAVLLFGFFVVWEVVHGENAGRVLADVEHLLAFTIGAALEWRAATPSALPPNPTMAACAS